MRQSGEDEGPRWERYFQIMGHGWEGALQALKDYIDRERAENDSALNAPEPHEIRGAPVKVGCRVHKHHRGVGGRGAALQRRVDDALDHGFHVAIERTHLRHDAPPRVRRRATCASVAA